MDLNAPLGMEPPRPRRRFGLLVGCVGAAGALAGLGALLATGDPRGGDPYAVAVLPDGVKPPANSPAVPGTGQAMDATPTGSLAAAVPSSPSVRPPGAAEPADEGSLENGVRVHRGSSGPVTTAAPAPAPLVIDVTHQLDAAPKLRSGAAAGPGGGLSGSGQGSAQGTKAKSPDGPRIAIYVGGMGLSQTATQTAIDTMPVGVTFAFLPYAPAATVAAAKGKGHEVLLQLPMQNTGGGMPGPHALRPDASPAALAGDLDWSMSRLDGYTGLANLLGAPVTANAAAMTAVLKAAAARNLFFLDDGTSKRSLAASLGPQMNVAVAQADLVLDATAEPAVVRANLNTLVGIARRKGQAIGMASGLPDHLPAIARFASDLAAKNIALVPVSALARHDASVATNTR